MSRVVQILIAESPSTPMIERSEALAVAGRGLEGDRYFTSIGTFSPAVPKPDFEITLIEAEKIAAFSAASGKPFTASLARRNIVTLGVNLNELVGRDFWLGEALLRGHRLCEPCAHLAKISFPETLRGLVHQCGLRAQILHGGIIRTGAAILISKHTIHA